MFLTGCDWVGLAGFENGVPRMGVGLVTRSDHDQFTKEWTHQGQRSDLHGDQVTSLEERGNMH